MFTYTVSLECYILPSAVIGSIVVVITFEMELTHLQRVRILYKTILKLHSSLPTEVQPLGNAYIRDEFKRHKNCSSAETAIFLSEWAKYAIELRKQLVVQDLKRAKPLGSNLEPEQIDSMRDDQLQQLYELHQASRNATTTES